MEASHVLLKLSFIFGQQWATLVILSKAEVLISNSSQNTTKTILSTWREGKERLREGQWLAWRLPATCFPAAESGAHLLLTLALRERVSFLRGGSLPSRRASCSLFTLHCRLSTAAPSPSLEQPVGFCCN